jgi:hypothetical protein
MPAARFTQAPNEVLDYEVDWSQWLPTGDSVIASTWTADNGITTSQASFTDTTTTVWISVTDVAMTGSSYNCVNNITTAAGRKGERTLAFMVKQL